MISPLAGTTGEEPSASPVAGLCTAARAGEVAATEGHASRTLGLAPTAAVELGPGVEVLAGGVGPWCTRGQKE